MLTEIKAKVHRIVDGKVKNFTESYLYDITDLYSEAEYALAAHFHDDDLVDDYQIIYIKQSPIKELLNSQEDESQTTYIATLKALYHDDKGNEKTLRYKTLLWASSLVEANKIANNIVREGYDMKVEGIVEKEYTLI